MTDSTRFIGPRGWAAFVLAGGAALSAPFLQKPGRLPDTEDSSGEMPRAIDFSNHAWPDLREEALTPPGQVTTNLSEQDWAELARLQNNSGAMPRKLTGNLPSTSGSPLPAWADRGPRVDQLVNDSIRTEPLAPTAPIASTEFEPLRPWMGQGMKPIAAAQTAASPTSDLHEGFAIASANPDARWRSIPSAAINADALTHDPRVLARNQPVGKFEDKVQQWPDEKLAPEQNAKPDTVSAPMVSAPSARPAPRLIKPTIESTKPPTTSPPRTKHFIQQPTKRA